MELLDKIRDKFNNRNVVLLVICQLLCGASLIMAFYCVMDVAVMGANKDYNKALKFNNENAEEFPYSVKTEQGGLYVEGEVLPASELVRNDNIPDGHMAIKEVYERYQQHTETYSCNCKTTNGHTSCQTCTRTYWSWDRIGSSVETLKTVSLLGQVIDAQVFPWAENWESIKTTEGNTYKYDNAWERTRFYVIDNASGAWGFTADENGLSYNADLVPNKESRLRGIQIAGTALCTLMVLTMSGVMLLHCYESGGKDIYQK